MSVRLMTLFNSFSTSTLFNSFQTLFFFTRIINHTLHGNLINCVHGIIKIKFIGIIDMTEH